MINLKKFVDRVSSAEGRNTRDVIIPIAEARGMRDELVKLFSDLYESMPPAKQEINDISVEIRGGKW